jgi:monoamine oxidase
VRRGEAVRDVIVVGAGLAGAAAAERLAQAGLRVTVLEARSRLGGRAYARGFAGQEPSLEMGGAWIRPAHLRLRALIAKYGLGLRPRLAVGRRRWFYAGAIHEDAPTPLADRAAHEAVLAQVARDAKAYQAGAAQDDYGRPLRGLSLAAYLDRLAPPPATRDLLTAWWCVSGNGDPARVAATELLASCGYGDGTPDSMIGEWAETVLPSMDRLAGALLSAPGISLERDCPVARLTQTKGGVEIEGGGRAFRASAAILATGINPMKAIEILPPLSASLPPTIAAGHLGASVKIWAEMADLEPGILATGGGTAIEWAFAERVTARGTSLVVGFGLHRAGFDPGNRDQIAAALARFFPEARLIAHDWHDWVADPFARGSWVAVSADHPEAFDASRWRCQGRIAFASSDIAPEQAGWFEGAVASGQQAAADIRTLLGCKAEG